MARHGRVELSDRMHPQPSPSNSTQTVVFQSCAEDSPRWIKACMTSVQAWSSVRGWSYSVIDDTEFLTLPPKQYRDKCRDFIQPLTDLARLEVASSLLSDGYKRVAWVDADVLVFSPEKLDLPLVEDCAFVKEIWLNPPNTDRPPAIVRVNNSVSVFAASSNFLPFYRTSCKTIAANTPGQLTKARVGTDFLTALHRVVPLQLIEHVGNLSPYVLQALVAESSDVLGTYARLLDKPIFAANLCSSHENRAYLGTSIRNGSAAYDEAVQLLLASGGAVIYDHARGTGGPLAVSED